MLEKMKLEKDFNSLLLFDKKIIISENKLSFLFKFL